MHDFRRHLASHDFNSWFRIWMPYGFFQSKDDPRRLLPFNRDYGILGCPNRTPIGSEDNYKHEIVFASDPRKFKSVWWDNNLFLYSDDPISLNTYFERLGNLMGHVNRLGYDRGR